MKLIYEEYDQATGLGFRVRTKYCEDYDTGKATQSYWVFALRDQVESGAAVATTETAFNPRAMVGPEMRAREIALERAIAIGVAGVARELAQREVI